MRKRKFNVGDIVYTNSRLITYAKGKFIAYNSHYNLRETEQFKDDEGLIVIASEPYDGTFSKSDAFNMVRLEGKSNSFPEYMFELFTRDDINIHRIIAEDWQ